MFQRWMSDLTASCTIFVHFCSRIIHARRSEELKQGFWIFFVELTSFQGGGGGLVSPGIMSGFKSPGRGSSYNLGFLK
jgi:hypothetical protein